MDTQALHDAIEDVCPIYGVSIGDENDRSTWRIDFEDVALDQEKAAAQAVIDNWVDPVPARLAMGKQLISALSDLGQLAAWDTAVMQTPKPADRYYWMACYENQVPESNAKIGRLAKLASVDLKALFDKAVTEPIK